MIEGDAKRVLLGVTLTHYATFLAGRADGLPIGDLVTLTGIQAASWAKAEHAWGERLLDDLEAEAIRFALTHYRGQMSEMARRLGIGRGAERLSTSARVANSPPPSHQYV